MLRVSPEQLEGTTGPKPPEKTAWDRAPKTKKQITEALAAAKAAEEALPKLQQTIAAKDQAARDLDSWNARHDWPQRQERAMAEAKAHIQKAREAETHLKRFVGQVCESPGWRAAVALQTINSERTAAMEALGSYVAVDFEKAREAAVEAGQADSMFMAKAHVAETASRTRVMDLLAGLDEGFDVCRSIPVDQRQIITILRMLLWPATMLQREKPDENRKGS